MRVVKEKLTYPAEAQNWCMFVHDFEYRGIEVPVEYCSL